MHNLRAIVVGFLTFSALVCGGCERSWFKPVPHSGRFAALRGESPAVSLTRQGDERKEAGDLPAALECFRRALAANPRHVPAHLGVGDVHQLLGDYAQAAEAYQRARDIAPNSFEANYKLAVMQQLLAKVQEAIHNYLSALTIHPDSFEANSNLAAAYMQIGRPHQALPYAERAAKLDPASQHAMLNLAGIYAAVGRDDEAILMYRGAADAGDLSPHGAVQFVNVLVRRGLDGRAINVLESVIRSHPDHAPAFERLGYVRFRQGEFDKSLEAYEAASRLSREDPAILNGLGVNLMAMYLRDSRSNTSFRDRAIEAWRASVRRNPHQPRIVDLINRYQGL
jgi:tetratricopeptide (TPR) repeat protein